MTPFFVVGIHTQPSQAWKEINSLVDVYTLFSNKIGVNFGFIMGDFNYGGTYVPQGLRGNLLIDNDPFLGLINEGTSVKTSLPYDRIYVAPRNVLGPHIITAAGVDRYSGSLINNQYYKTVSDHYPVYVEVNIGDNGGTNPPPG